MTDITSANITLQFNLQHLRCSLCQDYLSCRPILLLADERNVCGRCSSAITDSSALRNNILEKIVSNVSFPCKNKSYGCEKTFVFDSETDHSDKCAFKPLPCSFQTENSCEWIGALEQLPDHLTKQHSELITEQAKFTININEDTKRRLVVSQNDTVFLVDYLYNSKSLILRYTIAYFVSNLKNHFAKIQLINTADSDYTIQLKSGECCSYHDLFNSSKEVGINVHDSLTLLNNPTDILISVIVNSLPQQCSEVSQQCTNSRPHIDYDTLNLNRCCLCKYFLILPIFAYGQDFICNNCNYVQRRSSEAVDSEKSSLLSAQNYPCRWNGCNTITTGNHVNDHESCCNFRLYSCHDHECEAMFTFSSAKQHFLSHSYLFFENLIERNICFMNETVKNNLVTFAFNEIVRISYYINKNAYGNRFFCVTVTTSSYNKKKIKVEIKFKHQHCKVESVTFLVNMYEMQHISIWEMPTCFKQNEKLTAVIMVN